MLILNLIVKLKIMNCHYCKITKMTNSVGNCNSRTKKNLKNTCRGQEKIEKKFLGHGLIV